MSYYPVVLDLTGKRCLVVGGGQVASRKVRSLVDAGALVRVVAREITPELNDVSGIELCIRDYEPGDARGFTLVFAATDNRELNRRVYEDAVECGALVNVVDDPELCSFITPAVVRRGPLMIAVTTCGRGPALSRKIREELEVRYGPEYAGLAELLGELRSTARSVCASQKRREQAFRRIVESDILELIRDGRISKARQKALEYLTQDDNTA
ncbi:MAG: precorrin-2 dehydrogenase/sirohydrochlorin ferrochelatase family protein [Armatimonadota bacterium]